CALDALLVREPVKARAGAKQQRAQRGVLAVRECAEREDCLETAARFSGFAERDAKVALALGAASCCACAEVRVRAHDRALELRCEAAGQTGELLLARGNKLERFEHQAVRLEPFVCEVMIV